MPELVPGEASELKTGERCRGPMRSIAWTRVTAGTARLMALEPDLAAGDGPIPLVAGFWIEAGESGCTVLAGCQRCPIHPCSGPRSIAFIWRSSHAFGGRSCAQGRPGAATPVRARRADARADSRFAGAPRRDRGRQDPRLERRNCTTPIRLLASCRIVAAALGAAFPPSHRSAPGHAFRDVLEIARSARLRASPRSVAGRMVEARCRTARGLARARNAIRSR